jgi:hypothetical protein
MDCPAGRRATHDATTDRRYRALRSTIRERSTARVWIALAGFSAWAAAAVGTAAPWPLPVVTFIPLLLLALTFEIVLALHIGVERIGSTCRSSSKTPRPTPAGSTQLWPMR